MKDQVSKAASKARYHVSNRRDIYKGAVGGIFIGAGLMAFFRRPVKTTALVLVKVDAK